MRDVQIVERPFTKTIKWCNEKFDKRTKAVTQEKGWYYYEKSSVEGEKGVNIKLKEPFTFCWLTQALSFSGFNEKNNSNVYSNEILMYKNLESCFPKLATESTAEYKSRLDSMSVLTVKIGKETIAKGLFNDIKDTVKSSEVGGKTCNAVYGLLALENGEYEVVRFLMIGSSFSAWMEYSKKANLTKNAVMFNGKTIEKSKGSNDYEEPIFEQDLDTSKEFLKAADEKFKDVKNYFKYILSGAVETAELVEDDVPF